MAKQNFTGVYQLKNENWGYRYGVMVDGKTVWKRCTKDDDGNPFTTKLQAARARQKSLQSEHKQE